MSNPFQHLQKEYDTTLENIKKAEISENKDPSNRSLEQNYVHYVDNFYKVKQQAADLSNSMINYNRTLDIPQLQNCNNNMFNVAYPNLANEIQPLSNPLSNSNNKKPDNSIFLNDMFLGDRQGPIMNVLDMSNNFRSMANRNRRLQRADTVKCTNSSFSNSINQAQFRSGSDVVSMMADNGKVYQFDNGNRANAPMCNASQMNNTYQESAWLPQDLPVLTTMSKGQYLSNLAQQQQQAQAPLQHVPLQRGGGGVGLNNPRNPIWKPLDSKYLN